jgi:hypothetical protein
MFKNHSLDIKTTYQIGLIVVGLISLTLVVINVITLTKVLKQSPLEPTLKIREQQLQTAINAINPQAKD